MKHCICGRVCDQNTWNSRFGLCIDCAVHRYDEVQIRTYISAFNNGDLMWLYDELCVLKDKGEVWWEILNVESGELEIWCPYAVYTYNHLVGLLRHVDER